MAEAKIEQKVLTTPTFIGGSLRQAGEIVSVDMGDFVDENGEPASDKNLSNLADVGDAAVLVPAPIAAIAPTGPNPTQPQVVPAGSVQVSEGYVNGGALYVAEGSALAAEAAAGEGAAALNEGVEEEAVQRLSDTPQGAGTAGSGTNGTETGTANADGTGEPFTGEAAAPVALSGMNKADLLAQAKAEGVSDVTEDNNMAEIKAKIEAARAAS